MTDAGAGREGLYLDMVARYQSAILNYVYRLVGDADQAEDLTQETFLKAYRALAQLESAADADVRRRAWLYRIAHNTATDYLRRRARLSWLSLDSVLGHGSGDPAEPVIAREPIRRALAALPPDHRAVLHLFAQDGLSAAEVAVVLDISEAAARKRRQRARDAFEVAFRAAGGEP